MCSSDLIEVIVQIGANQLIGMFPRVVLSEVSWEGLLTACSCFDLYDMYLKLFGMIWQTSRTCLKGLLS